MPEPTADRTEEPEEQPPSYQQATEVVLTPNQRELGAARWNTKQRAAAEQEKSRRAMAPRHSNVKQEREAALADFRTKQYKELINRKPAPAPSSGGSPSSNEETPPGVADSSWEAWAFHIASARSLLATGRAAPAVDALGQPAPTTAGPSTARAPVFQAGAQQPASQSRLDGPRGSSESWGTMLDAYAFEVAGAANQPTGEPAQSSAEGPANPIRDEVQDLPPEQQLMFRASYAAQEQRQHGALRRLQHPANPVGGSSDRYAPSTNGTPGPSSQPPPSSVSGVAGQRPYRSPSPSRK